MQSPWDIMGVKSPWATGAAGGGLSASPGGAAVGGGGFAGSPGGPAAPSFGMPGLSGSPGGPGGFGAMDFSGSPGGPGAMGGGMGGMDLSGSPGGAGAFGSMDFSAPTSAGGLSPQQQAWNTMMPNNQLNLGQGGQYGAEVGSHLTQAALDPSKLSDSSWLSKMGQYGQNATQGSAVAGVSQPGFAASYNAGNPAGYGGAASTGFGLPPGAGSLQPKPLQWGSGGGILPGQHTGGSAPAPGMMGSIGGPIGGGGGPSATAPFMGGAMGTATGTTPGSEWFSPDRQQNIRNIYQQNLDNPAEISRSMREYGVSNDAFMRATGMDQAAFDKYMSPVFGPGGSTPGGGGGGAPGGPTMGGGMMPPGSGWHGSPGGPGVGGGGDSGSFTSNPFYSSIADDLQRRMGQFTDQRLNAIRGHAVGVGGLGGSRQGVAESGAISDAADHLGGQLAGLGSGMWGSDQDRSLSRYQGDASRSLSRYQGDQSYDLGSQNARNGFYTAQRGQDLQQLGLGADLYGRGISGEWDPLRHASSIYSPYSGMGTTTQSTSTGGGVMGGVGGALGAYQLWQNLMGGK